MYKLLKLSLAGIAIFWILANPLQAAESSSSTDIDKALQTLLSGYDAQAYLEVLRTDEITTEYYEISPGDTLDGIINRSVGKTSIRKDMMRRAFVVANPNAFPSGNPNRMLSGVRVRIPTADDVMSLIFSVDPAELEIAKRARESWVHFP